MKKLLVILAVTALCCPSCLDEKTGIGERPKGTPSKLVGMPVGDKEEGVILVKLSDKACDEIAEGTFDSESLIGDLDKAAFSRSIPVDGKSDAVAAKYGLHKWFTVTFDKNISPESAAEILSQKAEVEAVEYSILLRGETSTESVEYTPSLVTRSAGIAENLPFNDSRLADQWNLINDGSAEGSIAGADVGVKDAWRLTAGDPNIIVAVFDLGVADKHPDLRNAMWTNTGEIENNKIDDDNNGYVDDIHGYNFAEKKGKLTYLYGADHGTHVAGTIAATNNNGEGVSSIAGGSGKNDGVRIMSCQIFKHVPATQGWPAHTEQCSPTMIANAFYYAARQGACIAQCSYGYEDMYGYSSEQIQDWTEVENSVEYQAMMYFLDPENANCEALETNLLIFSAGNQNKPMSLYPGAFKECISVTAICNDFLPGGYSNYGAGCDIAAPGGDLTGNSKEDSDGAKCMILSTGIGRSGGLEYVYKHGTSMACPHVSGVVALGASYALKLGKKFSREEFISRLLSSANPIDSYITEGKTKLTFNNSDYEPVDLTIKKGKMGAGAVDAWKFLMALEGTPSFMAVPDQKLTINVAEHIGEGYTLEIEAEDAEALGIVGTPQVKDGILEITCTRIGSGKIRFKASVGKDENGVIPELDYYKYISIVSRPAVAANGGWL